LANFTHEAAEFISGLMFTIQKLVVSADVRISHLDVYPESMVLSLDSLYMELHYIRVCRAYWPRGTMQARFMGVE